MIIKEAKGQDLKLVGKNLSSLRSCYPGFNEWYDSKVIPKVASGERKVFLAENDDEYIWDSKTEQKLRKHKRFWTTLDNDDEVIFKIDFIGNGLDYLKLDCSFDNDDSGSHLTYYSITTSFCKSKYESGQCVNGRIPVTELIQDLEDALARKREAWGD